MSVFFCFLYTVGIFKVCILISHKFFLTDRTTGQWIYKNCSYIFTFLFIYFFFSASTDYFSQVQNNELRPHMRKEVAHWMLEVCEAEHCQPEIFCLAINYLDRFLSLCKIAQSQLQLLASVCLLVACKVRGHVTLPASKLVEYSDFNLDVLNIMVSIYLIFLI